MTQERKAIFSAANIMLLILVFLTIAGLSGLIAWATAVAEDTKSRRIVAAPTAQIAVLAAEIEQKINPSDAAIPEYLKNNNQTEGNLNNPREVTAQVLTETAPAPAAAPAHKIAWKNYAADYNRADPKPKIALIISEMGLMPAISNRAISELPGPVSFAFSPYAPAIKPLMQKSRALNHENLLQLPMEPLFYPNSDPGPLAILASRPWEENVKQLESLISLGESYVGFLGYMGSKYVAIDGAMRALLEDLQKRGYIFVDNGATPGAVSAKVAALVKSPFVSVTIQIDEDPAKKNITENLQKLEAEAKANGYAIGLARAYPVTIETVKQWANELPQRGISLVPVSAMLDATNP